MTCEGRALRACALARLARCVTVRAS